MIIFDDHMHLDPGGGAGSTVKRFLRAGGTHLMLVNKPYRGVCPGDFEEQYGVTLRMGRIAQECGARTYLALGPHPAEFVHLARMSGLESAVHKVRRGVKAALTHVREGRAVALGEVGRPHFPVEKGVWEASNALLAEMLTLAKDAGCAVILHTEHADVDVFHELAAMVSSSGMTPPRVVKHFSPPLILPEENFGLVPSLIASRSNLRRALVKGDRFMMESDHMDDPHRKDAVLPPESVPRRTLAFLRGGALSDRAAHRIHVELPSETYAVDME